MNKKYPEKMDDVPCEKCGITRKFRKIKHSGLYKNYKPLCACCSNRGRRHPTRERIDVIDNEQKAYAFGFFWADGCINRYKTFTIRLQTQDADILDSFHQYFGGIRLLRNLKRTDGRPYQQEEWVINDKVFIEKLKQCGFRQNLDAVPDELLFHFLRGFIDGDGHYSIVNGLFHQIVISGPIEEEFEWLTSRIDLSFKIKKVRTKTGNSTSLLIGGGHEHIASLVRKMYEGSAVSLRRKKLLVTPAMVLDMKMSRKARMKR